MSLKSAAMMARRRNTSPLGTLLFMYALSSGGILDLSAEERRPWGREDVLIPGASRSGGGAGGGALTAVLSNPGNAHRPQLVTHQDLLTHWSIDVEA